MSSVKLFKREKKRISILRRRIAKLCKPIHQEIDSLQAVINGCQHPISHVVEGEYRPDESYMGNHSTPPFRVCTICGYAEEGWGSGYKKLANKIGVSVKEMKRDEAWKLVKEFVQQNHR